MTNDITYKIKNLANEFIIDSEGAIDFLTNTTFTSKWPGGYDVLTATVSRNLLRTWAVKGAYSILVFYRNRIVWQGILDDPRSAYTASSSNTTITALGFGRIFSDDLSLRKRWIDINPIKSGRFKETPKRTGHIDQINRLSEIVQNQIHTRVSPKDTVLQFGQMTFLLRYAMPIGTNVKDISFSYFSRTGEGLRIEVINESFPSPAELTEDTFIVADGTGPGGQTTAANADLINTTIPDPGGPFDASMVGLSVINATTNITGTVIGFVDTTRLVTTMSDGVAWANLDVYVVHVPVVKTTTIANGNTEAISLQIGGAPYSSNPPGPVQKPFDTFDQNDIITLFSITVKGLYFAAHPDVGIETYTPGTIIEDVVIFAASQGRISVDTDGIDDFGSPLESFITRNDDFEPLTSIIGRLAAFSGANQDIYGFIVLDESGTSDNLPKTFLEKRSIDDWEYETTTFESNATIKFADQDQFNWIKLSRMDSEGNPQYLSPDSHPDLQDTVSISRYGKLMNKPTLLCGQCTEAAALNLGKSYLKYHSFPLPQASFRIVGDITTKGGGRVHGSQVRGGQRMKLTDFQPDPSNPNSSQIFFLRSTSYDVETVTLTANSDVAPDRFDIKKQQQRQGVFE